MPTYQEIITGGSIELPAVKPLVTIADVAYPVDTCTCVSAERRMGLSPGRAVFRFDQTVYQSSPITLNAADMGPVHPITAGSRVRVSVDGKDIWRGWLVRRQDSGENNSVQWIGLEDQWLLSKSFIRGCYVWDNTSGTIKYVESFTPHTNPGGLWNCVPVIGCDSDFNTITTYAFAPFAKKVMNYESPEGSDVGSGDVIGSYCAWTPKRFLQYLSYFCFNVSVFDGARDDLSTHSDHKAPLVSMHPSYLTLNYEDVTGMKGYDPADVSSEIDPVFKPGQDPLERKMAAVNFQGFTLAAALENTLDMAGTHGLILDYTSTTKHINTTHIKFVPIRWSGDKSKVGAPLCIQRAGTVLQSNSVYGFDLVEDITNYAETVAVDGAVVKVETRLECVANALGVVDTANSAIIPAWTAEEQYAWSAVVSGRLNPTTAQTKFAYYPKVPGSLSVADLVPADGSFDGSIARPSIYPRTPAAFNLAMQNYPTVFRAFKINNTKLVADGVLSGFDLRYANVDRWAKLNYNRPLYAEQLQYLIANLGRPEGDQANWLRGYLPIRISVKLENQWTEVQYQSGIRTTGDGLIWLDAFCAQSANNWESILGIRSDSYDNRMDWENVFNVILRTFAINAAMPTEYRVTGIATKMNMENMGWGIHGELRMALCGPPMAYFDQPTTYQEHNQVNSQPTANIAYAGGTSPGSTATWPLNRIVPPGSERPSAEYQALRKLRYLNAPRRESSWRLPGISIESAPGDFISEITPIGSGVTEKPYAIKAAVPRVVFDFIGQKTELGGLVSEFF